MPVSRELDCQTERREGSIHRSPCGICDRAIHSDHPGWREIRRLRSWQLEGKEINTVGHLQECLISPVHATSK